MNKNILQYHTCFNVDPLSDISVIYYTHKPNIHKHPEWERNVRNFYKITLIAKGSGILFCNESKIPVEPGLLYISHPEDLTSYQIHTESLEVYNILIRQNALLEYRNREDPGLSIFMTDFVPRKDGSHLILLRVKNEIPKLIRMMLREMSRNEIGSKEIRQQYLNLLLSCLERELREEKRQKFSEKLVSMVRNEIASGYSKKIDLQALAGKAGVSREHLGRVFHKACGMSISAAIKERRLQCAAELLSRTEEPVTKIAYRSGFSDLSCFFLEFKKRFGKKPGDFRKYGIK